MIYVAAITDALSKLAKKMGITEEADTIEEWVNLMNDKLDADNGKDISEAVDNYAESYESE